MIEKLPESTSAAFGFRVTGALATEDIAAISPQIEATIAHNRKPIGLLADLSGMHGTSWSARWDEMQFLRHHRDHIARVAVVSNDEWQELSERLVATASGLQAQTLYFHSSELLHAWHWVKGGRYNGGMPVRVIEPAGGLFSDYTPEYTGI